MSLTIPICKCVDIQDGCLVQALGVPTISGDALAHEIQLTVKDGGAAADLTGCTAVGSFVRADGSTVAVQGTISGNTVTVPFDETCYAYIGDMTITVSLSANGVTNSLLQLTAHLQRGRTNAVVDPGNILPSVPTLLAEVAAMTAATVACTSATEASTSAEELRLAAEADRESAEGARASAETERADAEDARQELFRFAVKANVSGESLNITKLLS